MTYSIGEFAELVGVATSTLRYYENEELLAPQRDENNIRIFTDADIGWVQFLLHLKDAGMTMAELKQYTKWRSMGEETIHDRMELLEKRQDLVKQDIENLQRNLDIISRKLAFYHDQLNGDKYEFVLYPNEEE
ncbi:MerR family transcriptional regulator [Gracilibacillus salinarum]|uniref:MerR family transcriptional regulator n=1 Tax=Gracilibacillus salinarum TaxID=2932255 RepID=A0ABY4GKH0_9BACI|nr:MerR family transcriptional regulator [Gracilibacillus salinarum]UOQ84704.1 MerR family transcriptional regulator [Gracilibacillus salinarum]